MLVDCVRTKVESLPTSSTEGSSAAMNALVQQRKLRILRRAGWRPASSEELAVCNLIRGPTG